jgi:hypothetical protein
MSIFEISPERITSDKDTIEDLIVWVQAPSSESMKIFARRNHSHYKKIVDSPEDDSGVDIIIDELGEIVERRV